MPVDRKALMKRMKAEKEAERAAIKAINFPMPDLRGPGGNAFVLLGTAGTLMKRAGIPEAIREQFHSEATKGDYANVLATIQKWFTVTVQNVEYVPIPDDFDLMSLRHRDDEEEDEEMQDPEEHPEALEEYLGSLEQSAEEKSAKEDMERQLTERLRQELGLHPDDVVMVNIKRVKRD